VFDKEDWKEWFLKFKWNFISFKFQAFWSSIVLFILSGYFICFVYLKSIDVVIFLHEKGYISKESVESIIIHTQSVLYDKALSSLLIFFGTLLTSIIAVKGVHYFSESQKYKAVVDKLKHDGSEEDRDLKKYLPK